MKLKELWGKIEVKFARHAALAARAIPFLDQKYFNKLEYLTKDYKKVIEQIKTENPFGAPIYESGWAGNGRVFNFSLINYPALQKVSRHHRT